MGYGDLDDAIGQNDIWDSRAGAQQVDVEGDGQLLLFARIEAATTRGLDTDAVPGLKMDPRVTA